MTAVSDASPIIALSRIGRLRILADVFGEIFIPETVRLEVLEGRENAPGLDQIVEAVALGWLKVTPIGRGTAHSALALLGAGESHAIRLAQEMHANSLIIDERLARRIAESLGLPVIGTLGVLLAARQQGHIPEVAPVLVELLADGFRIPRSVVDAVARAETRT